MYKSKKQIDNEACNKLPEGLMADSGGVDQSSETKDKGKGESLPWNLEKNEISN